MIRSHLAEGVLEQGDMQMDSFQKDGVKRVDYNSYMIMIKCILELPQSPLLSRTRLSLRVSLLVRVSLCIFSNILFKIERHNI